MLFEKQFVFYGTNAEHAAALWEGEKIFDRLYDVYLLGAVVGFLNKRRDPVKKDTKTEKTIFADILVANKDKLELIYKLIMLLDKEYEPVFDKRVDKAFRDIYDDKKNKKDFERFNDYVRGGVEILYKDLLDKPVATNDDKVFRLKDLVEHCSKFDGGIRELIKSIDI